MSASAISPANPGFVFRWDAPRRRKLSLLAFLGGSVALHALCFYLFQIIYPPTVALLPPPGRVSVISPASGEGQVLLRWIDAEDPALASTTQRPPDARAFALPKLEHVASYLTSGPALKEIPPSQPDLRVPSPLPPAPVPFPSGQAPSPLPVVKTSLAFSQEINTLGAPLVPEMHFTASTHEPPETAQFRVAVSPTGEVRYCFLQTSSGDAALDEQARKYLALCRFETTTAQVPDSADSLSWGSATVQWGSDLVTPKGTAPP